MELKIGDKISIDLYGENVELFSVTRDICRSCVFVFADKNVAKRHRTSYFNWGHTISGTIFPDEHYHSTTNKCFIIYDINAEILTDRITFISHNCQEYKDFVNRHKAWFDTTKKKCSICGKKSCLTNIVVSNNKKNICKSCLTIRSYGFRNNVNFGVPTKSGAKYGFELECVSKNKKDKDIAEVLSMNRGLIPTSDASLPRNGVEFKTPILNNLRGVEKMLETMSKYWDFQNEKCGQHINISIPEFTESVRKFMIDNCVPLTRLSDYMACHIEETKTVCGRYFTGYAGNIDDYELHCNWLNLSHSGRAEFRLSKVVTPAQYISLAKMWTEILYYCVNYYNEFTSKSVTQCSDDVLTKIDEKYGLKMIGIFDKYYKKISEMT